MSAKIKVLWIGDACVSSGFALATHRTLPGFMNAGCEVHVLGLNHTGDPHKYQSLYDVYQCFSGGDAWGLGRIRELLARIQPDLIVVQNDPWNFGAYLDAIDATGMKVPVIGAVAVDGKNCRGEEMNRLVGAIFWTQFGLDEARRGGYTKPAAVIPLGVDTADFFPIEREKARQRLRIDALMASRGLPPNPFVFGIVGRNQPRKRLDLALQYFAEFYERVPESNPLLWMHIAPTGEQAYHLDQLAAYYGVMDRVMVPDVQPIHGATIELLRYGYNIMDVGLYTTQGEGFGLPAFEMMACGVPVIAPDWSGLGELLNKGAALLIPCTSNVTTDRGINVIGGIADKDQFVQAMESLYRNEGLRTAYRETGFARAKAPCYKWDNIAKQFAEYSLQILADVKAAVA